jgi:hypothetical protein
MLLLPGGMNAVVSSGTGFPAVSDKTLALNSHQPLLSARRWSVRGPEQVEAWQKCELTGVTAKVVIYEALVGGELEAPKHLARTVHDLYFLCGAEIYVASASGRS